MTMAMINNKWFKVIKEFKSWGPSGYRARCFWRAASPSPPTPPRKSSLWACDKQKEEMKMKNNFFNALLCVACTIICVLCLITRVTIMDENAKSANQRAATVETIEPLDWDMTALDGWCRGMDQGTLRMVGAWVYEQEDNVTVLEDEQGNLWAVEDVTINADDFVLLWLVDNHTQDVVDDEIIKVWVEAH